MSRLADKADAEKTAQRQLPGITPGKVVFGGNIDRNEENRDFAIPNAILIWHTNRPQFKRQRERSRPSDKVYVP